MFCTLFRLKRFISHRLVLFNPVEFFFGEVDTKFLQLKRFTVRGVLGEFHSSKDNGGTVIPTFPPTGALRVIAAISRYFVNICIFLRREFNPQ